MRFGRELVGVCALLVVGLVTTSACAQESWAEPTRAPTPWEISASAGYVTPPIRGGTTPFGAGLAARLGGNIGALYLGGRIAGFLGGSDVDVTDRSVLYGLELGYSLRAVTTESIRLTFRPQLGLGGLTVFHTDPSSATAQVDVVSSASGGSSSDTTTVSTVYVEPSLPLLLASGTMFFGLRPSVLVVPRIAYSGAEAATWLCYGLQAELGVRF